MSPFWRSLRPFSNFFSRYHFHNQNFCSKMRNRIFNYPIWICEAVPVKLGKGADQYACKFDHSDDELRALLVTTYQRSKIGTRKHWLYEIWTPGGANSTSRPTIVLPFISGQLVCFTLEELSRKEETSCSLVVSTILPSEVTLSMKTTLTLLRAI